MNAPILRGTPTCSSRTGIAILLCTHQGQRFLAPQLDSIHLQSRNDWSLYVSDDRSTDQTLEILGAYRNKWGDERLSVRVGPGQGFRANFLSLACAPDIQARYFAFADQDDLWDEDKLATATAWLDRMPANVPALYCARTRLIDEHDNTVGYSHLFQRPVTFRNALVQSIAGGNTMMFNVAARSLLMEAGCDIDVQTHDWWAYMVVTGCGGNVFYDLRPTVRYRQHGANLVGSNASLSGRYQRARKLLAGRFRNMNGRNLAALQRIRHRLTPENQVVLEEFERARQQGLAGRVMGMRRSGVYCHTSLGNLGLAAATVFKKF